MRKIILFTVTVLAAIMALVPLTANAIPPGVHVVALAYGNDIDGPVATALAIDNDDEGIGTRAMETEYFRGHHMGEFVRGLQCVVAVGHDASNNSDVQSMEHYGIKVVYADGGDRYETALLASRAVDECNDSIQ